MKWLVGTLVVALAAEVSLAAMQRGPMPKTAGEGTETTPYSQAEAAARNGKCKEAVSLLEELLAADRDDADALNLLAYCQRKAGRLDEAFANYHRALELRPEFPAAREYLGEAHLQAALQQVEILRGYGEPAREELAKLVAALQDAAVKAGDAQPPVRKAW